MDRVQIGAIGLAILLLVYWFAVVPRPTSGPSPPPADPAEVSKPYEPRFPTIEPEPARGDTARHEPRYDPKKITRAKLENDAVRLEISSLGARLESVKLKQFPAEITEGSGPVELVTLAQRGTGFVGLGEGVFRGLEAIPHEWAERSALEARLEVERDGIRVERTVTLDERGYGGWIRVVVQNRSEHPVSPRFQLIWNGAERPAEASDRFQNYELVALVDGSLERRAISGIGRAGFFSRVFGGAAWEGEAYATAVEWAGLASQYFLMVGMVESTDEVRAYFGPLGPDSGVAMLGYPSFEIPPGRQLERRYRIYFGPKIETAVAAVDPRIDPALQVGYAWISPLVRLFERMLGGTYRNLVPNYGIAIILLTILLRVVTYPLTQKSMRSMRRFSQISPEMKKLQEAHKGDKTRLQQEMMALYQRKGINPIAAMGGGCLPMLIQFPFLIALYFALQGSIELRHAPFFGWINDLSAPESLFSIAGVPIRLLPLMMGGTMVLQQKLTPAAGADPQQRQMMMWMSVMFIFLFYQFPSGLVLYWFVSNLLGIGQQFLVNRSA